jgi:hypothetical protein
MYFCVGDAEANHNTYNNKKIDLMNGKLVNIFPCNGLNNDTDLDCAPRKIYYQR